MTPAPTPGPAAEAWALPRAVHDTLREAVAELRRSDRRRSFPPVLHVGHPGRVDADFVDLPAHRLDHDLRAEVVAALLSRCRPVLSRPVTWLTRPGSPVTEDVDLAWYAAARAAYGEAGVALMMVVVTPDGWYDPRTDTRRQWKRLRIRSRSPDRSVPGVHGLVGVHALPVVDQGET